SRASRRQDWRASRPSPTPNGSPRGFDRRRTAITGGHMRGIVFKGERELELMEFADPVPGVGEVVLEMKASGMCGSDLHAYRAKRGGMGAALGLGGDGSPVIA